MFLSLLWLLLLMIQCYLLVKQNIKKKQTRKTKKKLANSATNAGNIFGARRRWPPTGWSIPASAPSPVISAPSVSIKTRISRNTSSSTPVGCWHILPITLPVIILPPPPSLSPLSLSLFLIFQFSDTEIFNEFLSLLNPINEAFNTFTNDIFIELIVTITRLDISSRHYLENYHHNMDAKNTCHHLIVRSAIHGHNIDSVMKYHLMVIQTQTHPQTRFRLRPIPDAISNESEQQFGSRSLPAFSLFRNIDNVIVNLIPIESVGHYRFILLSVGFRPWKVGNGTIFETTITA